ncbi:MAG: NIL domain-containing protein [Armatimonadetes bacterium]|nr:NIL domain-containing protein [Armatimonadota bacterium]
MTTVDLSIVAREENAQSPWLWKLSREFPNLKFNIVRANIDSDFATVELQLIGAVEEIQRATSWLMTTGMSIEAKQRAMGVS